MSIPASDIINSGITNNSNDDLLSSSSSNEELDFIDDEFENIKDQEEILLEKGFSMDDPYSLEIDMIEGIFGLEEIK